MQDGPRRTIAVTSAAGPVLALSLYLPVYSSQPRRGQQPSLPVVRCVFQSDSRSLTLDVPPSETSAWRAVARVLRSPVDGLCCALFPSTCRLCGLPLLLFSRVPVCSTCLLTPKPQSGKLCFRCGEDLGIATLSTVETTLSTGETWSDGRPEAEQLCQPCRLAPPTFLRATAYGVYESHLRELIHLLKYERMQPVARVLGVWLADAIDLALAEPEPDPAAALLVVPVPMHASRRRKRGADHAELLTRAALVHSRRRHPETHFRLATGVLQRKRATQSQAGLTTRQRRQNVRGAFLVSRPDRLAGQHVLLIDDIYTTGATARACTQALLRAGAASVRVATLARAQREGVAFWDAPVTHTPVTHPQPSHRQQVQ